MRVVIDTNVLVSGLVFDGVPGQLLERIDTGDFDLCISETLLAELQNVLSRAKFVNRLHQTGSTAQGIAASLRCLATIVTPTEVPRIVPADPDDDHVVAAAVAGEADLIVTGDSHLLTLGSHMGIAIVTARQALDCIAASKR